MPIRKLPPSSNEGISRWMRQAICVAHGIPMYFPRQPLAAGAFPPLLAAPLPTRGTVVSVLWQSGLKKLELQKEQRQPLVCSRFSSSSLGGLFCQSPQEINTHLVTPAITENVLQFSCVEHGQEIIFKDSCSIQGILFPFPFILHTKKLGWKALPSWMLCHRNLTAVLRMEKITQKMTEIVSNTFFAAPETLVLQYIHFPMNAGKAGNSACCVFPEEQDSRALDLSCSGQQDQAFSWLCRKVSVGHRVRNKKKKKALAFL